METLLKLPVGIEDFQEIRESGFCYIDKTNQNCYINIMEKRPSF